MKHSEGFLKLVNEAKTRIQETTVAETQKKLSSDSNVKLIDVREDKEWDAAHAAKAIHLGKGIIERDIEQLVPDKSTELILYCGGGYRSALAADVLQTMVIALSPSTTINTNESLTIFDILGNSLRIELTLNAPYNKTHRP